MNFLAFILCTFTLPGQAFAVTGRAAGVEAAKLAKSSVALVQPADETRTCSGVLISKSQVITSAHCVRPQEDMIVKFDGFDSIPVVNTILNPVWVSNYPRFLEFMKAQREIERAHRRLVARSAELNLYVDNEQREAAARKIEIEGEELRARGRELLASAQFPGDLAILELDPQKVPAGLEAVTIDFEFQPRTQKEAEIVLAGYGMNDYGGSGILTLASASISGVMSDWFMIGGAGQFCPGDSGGMTARLVDSKLHLVAVNGDVVVQEGGKECVVGQSYGLATKLADHEAWILAFIKK